MKMTGTVFLVFIFVWIQLSCSHCSVVLGSLLVAEKYDMPMIIQSPGIPGGSECVQDKWPVKIFELYLLKPFVSKCRKFIENKRAELNLPNLDYQGGFLGTEYSDRFPMFVPTSPSVYPKPHPSVEHVYLGGLRDEKLHPKLSPELELWIGKNGNDIVYISLGTHSTLENEELKTFVENLKSQSKLRFIWSLGLGLENKAKSLNIFDEKHDSVFLSNYLPQYTLLGHPSVKIYVSHCGLGSMVDQISRAIPGIFVPQFGDQFSNAAKLESLKTGITLKEFKFELLFEAIQMVTKNYESFKTNLVLLQNEFKQYENHEAINEFALKVASRKKLSIKTKLPYQVNCPRVAMFWNLIKVVFTILGTCLLYLICKLLWRCCKKRAKTQKKNK